MPFGAVSVSFNGWWPMERFLEYRQFLGAPPNSPTAEMILKQTRIRLGMAIAMIVAGICRLEAASYTLSQSDLVDTTSWNAALNWPSAPSAGNTYSTGPFELRTPPSPTPAGRFGGDSLTIPTGGALRFKGPNNDTATVENLVLDGGTIFNGNANATFNLAGTVSVSRGSSMAGGTNRTLNIPATLTGTGALTHGLASAKLGTFSYSGTNSGFTGAMVVTNGVVLRVGAQENLGGNPPTFNGAQLLLDSGTLSATASFAIHNPNSGVTINAGGGGLNVAAGHALTVANPITGPGALVCSGSGTVVLSGTNTYTGETFVNGGALVAVSPRSVGANSITVGANAAFETLCDLNHPFGDLVVNGRIHLHQDLTFQNVSVAGVPLAPGTYSFAQLNALYPANFPASWTPLPGGDGSTSGSGSITVVGPPDASTHVLESSLLRLTVTGNPFSFNVVEKATGTVLVQQTATRFVTSGTYSVSAASGFVLTGTSLQAELLLNGTQPTDRLTAQVRFVFSEPEILRATLSSDLFTPGQIFQQFADQGEEIFGGFECPFNGSLSSRNISNKLAQNLGLGGILNTSSAKAPFFLTSRRYGIYAQTDALGTLTMAQEGFTSFSFQVAELTFHIIHGDYAAIMSGYNRLAGGSFMPPLWSLDSIWWKDSDYIGLPPGVPNAQASVLDTADKLAANQIRAGAILVDRPYGTTGALTSGTTYKGDGGWGNFDFDPVGFPDPVGMVAELQSKGLNLMLWVSDHCWSNLHDEAEANNWLFYPTRSYTTVDLQNPAAYSWLRNKFDSFVNLGVAGYKIDRGDEGESPDLYNNRNNTLFQKLTMDGLNAANPGNGFTFSRCASDTARQHTALWNGDSYATWTGLQYSIISGLRAGILNFPMWGSDTGSYRNKPTEELFARWMQFSAYSPMMEVLIGGTGTGARTPWYDYSSNLVAIAREQAAAHHDLMPYSRSHLYQATQTGMPVMRPIMFAYPNDPNLTLTSTNCQYLFGGEILVAPVIIGSATTREVYLPAAKWLDYNNRKDLYVGPATIVADAPLEKIPLFVNEGAIIPRGDIYQGNNTWTPNWAPRLRIEFFPSDDFPSSFPYYTGGAVRNINCSRTGSAWTIQFGDLWYPGTLDIYVRNPGEVVRNGVTLSFGTDYTYDPETNLLRVPFNGPTTLIIKNATSLFASAPRPFEAWRLATFGNTGNPALSAPGSDPDGNGISNLVQYALGGAGDGAPNVAVTPTGNLEITFKCDTACSDVEYVVQVSPDMGTWTDVARSVGGATVVAINGSGAVVGDAGIGRRPVTVAVPRSTPSEGRRFARLKVTAE